MLALSLIVNLAIVLPLTAALLARMPAMATVYGPDSPARRILACLYGTIGAVSLWALWLLLTGAPDRAAAIAGPLLVLQIVYKLATAPAVGLRSPVVLTNLAVSLLHGATLATL